MRKIIILLTIVYMIFTIVSPILVFDYFYGYPPDWANVLLVLNIPLCIFTSHKILQKCETRR